MLFRIKFVRKFFFCLKTSFFFWRWQKRKKMRCNNCSVRKKKEEKTELFSWLLHFFFFRPQKVNLFIMIIQYKGCSPLMWSYFFTVERQLMSFPFWLTFFSFFLLFLPSFQIYFFKKLSSVFFYFPQPFFCCAVKAYVSIWLIFNQLQPRKDKKCPKKPLSIIDKSNQ